jgi:hypothetical protein
MQTEAPNDYYALLGVAVDVDATELRRTWRRLALRWHPDRAGTGATATFQKLSEAYTVLSDPLARAAYDRRRGRAPRNTATAPSPPPAPAPTPARRRAPGVMLSRLSGPLKSLLACGVARRAEGGIIELLLDAHEAEQGGMVTISMRVPVRCAACSPDTAASCPRCGGTRAVEDLFSAWLSVPPGVADGTLLTPSAQLRGMLHPATFRVRRGGSP